MRVFSTEEFDTWERILSKNYQREIDLIIQQLKETANVGKPLGYSYFREKKFDKYRAYFLVYEELDAILLVTISDKKTQQDTINRIKRELDHYKDLIKRKLNAL